MVRTCWCAFNMLKPGDGGGGQKGGQEHGVPTLSLVLLQALLWGDTIQPSQNLFGWLSSLQSVDDHVPQGLYLYASKFSEMSFRIV